MLFFNLFIPHDIFRDIKLNVFKTEIHSFLACEHSFLTLTHIFKPIWLLTFGFGVSVLEALKQAFADRMSSRCWSLASLAKSKHRTAAIGKIIIAVQAGGPLNARVWGLYFQRRSRHIFHQYLTRRSSSEKRHVYATPANSLGYALENTRAAVG